MARSVPGVLRVPSLPADARRQVMFPLIVAAVVVFTCWLAVTPGAAVDTELEVSNTAPTVVSVTPVGLTSPLFPVSPDAGGTKEVTVEVAVEDLNGCNDIDNVAITVKDPSDGTLNTYTLTTRDSCSALTLATYSFNHSVEFYHDPGDYDIEVVATDSAAATGNNLLDLTSFQVQELVSLSIPAGTFSLGASLDPGELTSIQSMTITNTGNVEIDTEVAGTALSHSTASDEIPLANVTWGLQSDLSDGSTLTDSATSASGFDLSKGSSSTGSLYWQVDVPKALAPGTYSGTLTVTAVKST